MRFFFALTVIDSSGNQVDRLVKVYDAIMNSFSSEQREYINSLGADEDREFWREVSCYSLFYPRFQSGLSFPRRYIVTPIMGETTTRAMSRTTPINTCSRPGHSARH